jgi:modification methylase
MLRSHKSNVLKQSVMTKPPIPLRSHEGFGPTEHDVYEGDARHLSFIPTESVHLICTSPPYGSLKEYPDHPNQLGNIGSYEKFLDELDAVWAECRRILVPGGRVACIVGDVCISRRKGGRHHVLPLSGDLQVRARKLEFDNLTPIRWLKVSNIKLEASKSARYLGKPNLPNGIVKNDVEHILFFRKPGGYRKPTEEMERLSFISTDDYIKWFSPVWDDVRGQLRRDHPAPFPIEIPRRLIRMYSFVGDTVVDPFAGTGTTALAALETGRNSVSVEIEPTYVEQIRLRLKGRSSFITKIRIHSKESPLPTIESRTA